MVPEEIFTDKAPRPGGSYSQALRSGSFIFCSGQVGIDPKTGELVPGGIEAETRQVLNNLNAILVAAGTDFDKVVKVEAFILDINDWKRFNDIYAEYFKGTKPARAAVAVSGLPKGAKVEVSCIAVIG